VEVVTEPIPKELEWGEVLVNIRAMPISPGDLYNIKMGATPYTVRQPAAHPSQWRSGSRTRVALSRMARG
jgi:NADPH:quinone reductase-like Zn-dependent oxidoreductase